MSRTLGWWLSSAALPACAFFTDLDGLSSPPPVSPEDGGVAEAGGDAAPPEGGAAPTSSRYRDAVLADKPVVYWRMVSDSSLVVRDETGSGNALALRGFSGGPGEGALVGDADPAFKLDGKTNGGQAKTPRALDFPGTSPFSIEVWLRHDSFSASAEFHGIVSNATGNASADSIGYVLYTSRESPDRLTFARRGSGDGKLVSATIPQNRYVYCVVTYDGAMIHMYIDGAPMASLAASDSIGPRTSEMYVGFNDAGAYFPGLLDEIAIYDRALSAVDVARHHDVALGR